MVVLKKEDVISGKNLIKTIHIEALNEDVDLRPITDAELNEIEGIRQDLGNFEVPVKNDGTKTKDQMLEELNIQVDTSKIIKQLQKSNAKCASFGLSHSGEKWSVNDVEKLPAGSTAQIAAAVYDISKLSKPDELVAELDSFRGK